MARGGADYWRPAAALAPYVLSYSRYHVDTIPGEPVTEPFFAAWATLRITVGGGGWSFRIGSRHYAPVPPIALFGASSVLGLGTTEGETSFGVGISPVGWARLVRLDASAFSNRVTPAAVLGALDFRGVAAALKEGAPVAETFDRLLTARLAASVPEPPVVRAVYDLLGDPSIATVADLSARTGQSAAQLTRIVPVHFGFTPKVLMRRRRFMRALMIAKDLPRGQWSEASASCGYYDQAHFLRDCQSFLGMSLTRFIEMPKTLANEAFRRRSAVVGVPVQVLQPGTAASDDRVGHVAGEIAGNRDVILADR